MLGRFDVPLLLMERIGVQIALNPITRFPGNAEGGVDLYIVPAYDEVDGLCLESGVWNLYYGFQEEGPRDYRREVDVMLLSESSLVRVMDAMVARDLARL